jgi:phage repressor protein C with HTH and peptisase S24 domain
MKSPKSSGKPKKRKLLILRRVVGESMLPTLSPGRVVLATGWHGPLHKEDVVIIRHRGLEKVKRVQHISETGLFVQGDNRTRSTDSHTFGWLDLDTVVGKVVWPRV